MVAVGAGVLVARSGGAGAWWWPGGAHVRSGEHAGRALGELLVGQRLHFAANLGVQRSVGL